MACIYIKITPKSELHPKILADLYERVSGISITAFSELIDFEAVFAERLKGFNISRVCSVGGKL